MIFPRPTAFRTPLASQFTRSTKHLPSANHLPWQRIIQHSSKRYSSTGEAVKKAGSDLPWLVGALSASAIGGYFMIQQTPEAHGSGHGGGHGPEGHEEHEENEEAEEQPQEAAQKESEEKSSDEPQVEKEEQEETPEVSENEGKKPDAPSSDDQLEKSQNKPLLSEKDGEPSTQNQEHVTQTPENKGGVEGVRFKGATKQGGDDHAASDTRKQIPDAKGGAKKRIDSDYGIPIGADEPMRESGEGNELDKAASSKPPVKDQISDKQKGLSTTDTKHSTDVASDPEKSTKAEGTAETAKVKGSVDPSRNEG